MCTPSWRHSAAATQTQTSRLLTHIFNILQNWWNAKKREAWFSAATRCAVNGASRLLSPSRELERSGVIKGSALGHICRVTGCCCLRHKYVCVFSFCIFCSVPLLTASSLSRWPCPGSYSVFKCIWNNWPSLSSQDYENKSPFGGEQCQQSLKSCYMGYYPATNCFFSKS